MKKNPKAFVIEDSKILSEIIGFHLKLKFDCQVSCFENGNELLSNIKTHHPDVIVLDYNFNSSVLEFENGLEVLIQLRKLSNIPVIVFSGQQNKEKAFELLDAGANGYISKEEDDFMDHLLASVEDVLA